MDKTKSIFHKNVTTYCEGTLYSVFGGPEFDIAQDPAPISVKRGPYTFYEIYQRSHVLHVKCNTSALFLNN